MVPNFNVTCLQSASEYLPLKLVNPPTSPSDSFYVRSVDKVQAPARLVDLLHLREPDLVLAGDQAQGLLPQAQLALREAVDLRAHGARGADQNTLEYTRAIQETLQYTGTTKLNSQTVKAAVTEAPEWQPEAQALSVTREEL